jgi:hypothetical protein
LAIVQSVRFIPYSVEFFGIRNHVGTRSVSRLNRPLEDFVNRSTPGRSRSQ